MPRIKERHRTPRVHSRQANHRHNCWRSCMIGCRSTPVSTREKESSEPDRPVQWLGEEFVLFDTALRINQLFQTIWKQSHIQLSSKVTTSTVRRPYIRRKPLLLASFRQIGIVSVEPTLKMSLAAERSKLYWKWISSLSLGLTIQRRYRGFANRIDSSYFSNAMHRCHSHWRWASRRISIIEREKAAYRCCSLVKVLSVLEKIIPMIDFPFSFTLLRRHLIRLVHS